MLLDDGERPLPACELIWAGDVLEHVHDCVGLLARCHEALVPGGRLLISTPDHPRRMLVSAILPGRFEARFDPRSDHVRFFTARSLRTVLEDAGFEAIDVRRTRAGLLASSCRPARPAEQPGG
ncbi:MAG: hypothetical protein NVSMB51_00060 [Solirubrobacteraceae bacterium]